MEVLDVKMTLLPDRDDHHKLAFAAVTIGNGRPLLVLRPFCVLRSDDGSLRVQGPQRPDKKNGRPYRYVELIDKGLNQAVEEEVIRKFQAMQLLAKAPAAPGRAKGWHHVPQAKRRGRIRR